MATARTYTLVLNPILQVCEPLERINERTLLKLDDVRPEPWRAARLGVQARLGVFHSRMLSYLQVGGAEVCAGRAVRGGAGRRSDSLHLSSLGNSPPRSATPPGAAAL